MINNNINLLIDRLLSLEIKFIFQYDLIEIFFFWNLF